MNSYRGSYGGIASGIDSNVEGERRRGAAMAKR